MDNNVFIIGNGFDLDLGLKTKYSNFADSEYWIRDDRILMCKSFNNSRNKDTWFDLEGELLNYSKRYDANDHSFKDYMKEVQFPEIVKENVNYFKNLRSSLNDYIEKVQKEQEIKKECTACGVLKAIYTNGLFPNIYSFNYTDLNHIAKQIGIAEEIKYTHIHGSIADKSIILGVDETELRKGYECFHKSSSRYYRSHDLYNSLIKAKEIVIFGLSLGSVDYSYFDAFFRRITEGGLIDENEKQFITIFTLNDESRLSLVSNLRNMGINIQRLYAQSHFQIICTEDDGEKKELEDFYGRLKKFNREFYLKNPEVVRF